MILKPIFQPKSQVLNFFEGDYRTANTKFEHNYGHYENAPLMEI